MKIIAIAIRKEPVFCVFIEFVYRNRDETIECIMIYHMSQPRNWLSQKACAIPIINFLFEFIYDGK